MTGSPLFTQISTFWSNWRLALTFQHFDWFPILSSNLNILIDSLVFKFQQCGSIPSFAIKHKHLLNLFFFAQISTFSLIIAFSLKFQHFDRFLTLSSNFNILINSLFFNQIPIIWSISTFAIEYQHLIELPFFSQISTFWSIWHFALKFQHCDQFQPYCTQTSTFDLFPTFHSQYIILNDLVISTQISTFLIDSQFCP